MGCGGCMNGSDAAEFLLLGAGLVQLGTAVMFEGYGLIDAMKRDLLGFLDRHGFGSVSDCVGAGRERVTSYGELDGSFRTQARIDLLRCARCGKCVTACRDGGYQAIAVEAAGAYPRIDENACTGCSLCAQVCPFGAIHMVNAGGEG